MSVNEPGSRTSPDQVPDPEDRPPAGAPAAGDSTHAGDSASAAEAAPTADGKAAGGKATGGKAAGGKAAAKKPRKLSFWIEFPILVVVALLLMLVVKTWIVQAFYIPSGSMQNTLAIGDRILVNKLVYHFRGIARGDIVVFNGDGSWNPQPPPSSSNPLVRFIDDVKGIADGSEGGDIYVKRVIGLPGDRVACCNARGQITVNGVALSESSYLYPDNAPSQQRFNIVVPPGRLWVMGDHRAISYDSRGHMGDPGGGTIPESQVLGRAFVIVWPPSQWKVLNIPATFSQPKLHAAALGSGVPVRQAGTSLPLVLGFAGAIPVTAAEAAVRRRLSSRRRAARKDRSG